MPRLGKVRQGHHKLSCSDSKSEMWANCIHRRFLAIPGTTTASSHPLGIVGGAVKLRSGLQGFVLSHQGGRPRLREHSGYSGLTQGTEYGRDFDRLIEPFHAL